MNVYEKGYFSWFWKSNRKRILTYVVFLFAVVFLPAMLLVEGQQDSGLPFMLPIWIIFWVSVFTAIALPILQFQFLLRKRSCDLYLPMPIGRSHFFLMQYGLGLIILLLPMGMLLLGLLLLGSWEFMPYYAIQVCGMYLFAAAAYSMVTFFVVRCNSVWDAICAAVGFSVAFPLLLVSISEMLDTIVREITIGAMGSSEFFPIDQLAYVMSPISAGIRWTQGLSSAVIFSQLDGKDQSIWTFWQQESGFSLWVIVFWALVLLMCVVFAYRFYLKRSMEDSEQRTTSVSVYPLLILLITVSLMIQNILSASYLLLTVVVFLVLNFIAERRIIVRKNMVISFVVMGLLTGTCATVLKETKGFGKIYEIPAAEDIKAVQISIQLQRYVSIEEKLHDGSTEQKKFQTVSQSELVKDEELIKKAYELQKLLISNDVADLDGYVGDVRISYEFQSGKIASRYYSFTTASEIALVKETATYMVQHRLYDASISYEFNEEEG